MLHRGKSIYIYTIYVPIGTDPYSACHTQVIVIPKHYVTNTYCN